MRSIVSLLLLASQLYDCLALIHLSSPQRISIRNEALPKAIPEGMGVLFVGGLIFSLIESVKVVRQSNVVLVERYFSLLYVQLFLVLI